MAERERGGRGRSLPRPLLAVPNVTAHPSTVTVTNHRNCCPLLCSFNPPIKDVKSIAVRHIIGPKVSSLSRQAANVKCYVDLLTIKCVA